MAQWRTYEGYADAERVALEYAEKFAIDHKQLDDEFFSRMRKHFSDEKIVEISFCVGTWLALGRVTMVMDVNTSCPLRLPLEEPEAQAERTVR